MEPENTGLILVTEEPKKPTAKEKRIVKQAARVEAVRVKCYKKLWRDKEYCPGCSMESKCQADADAPPKEDEQNGK